MLYKFLLPLLALLGALFGLYEVYLSRKEIPVQPILFPPAKSPYAHSIAGAGIIEASSQNISVGTPFNEIITEIYVVEGDHVKIGQPLFKLDTRTFEAQAKAAKAAIDLAMVEYENLQKQFSFYQRLKDTKAVSEQAFEQARYSFFQAEENLKVAQANLEVALISIQRSTILSPIDGDILQVNAHIGEIAPIMPFTSSQSTWKTAAYGTIMLIGTVNPLQVRIDIDEDDAWRYKPNANATAFVRGNRNIQFPLHFFRTEPYMIPKRSFTGDTVQRVDTRVLQTLYVFEKNDLPVYAGQVLDIFIETDPIEPHGYL